MGFKNVHPAINFIYFAAVIAGAAMLSDRWFLACSAVAAFVYSIKLNRKKAVVFNVILMIAVAGFAAYYALFNHFGATVLFKNFIDNRITAESLFKGLTSGLEIGAVVMWLSCVFAIITADKVVYVFGKLSPRLSLFVSVILRMAPRIKVFAKKINAAQKGMGRGINQGNIFRRMHNLIRIFSALVTVTIDSFSEVSGSMKNRGGDLKKRTAFSIYRFDNRDRGFVIVMFAGILSAVFSGMLGISFAGFDPYLRVSDVTPVYCILLVLYAVLCGMPFALDIYTEWRFKRARKNAFYVKKHPVCG